MRNRRPGPAAAPAGDARRREALREILDAEPIRVPSSPAQLAAEIEASYDDPAT